MFRTDVRSYKSSTKEGGKTSPARLIVFTESGTASARKSSDMTEGTVLISVTLLEADSSGRANAFGTTMTVPPTLQGTKISNIERSKHSEVENRVPASSCGVNTVCAHSTKFTALRCSRATPFGEPVEPEVNRT